MRKINHKKNLTVSIILLLMLIIGIGYAYLTSNLSISGNTEVVANTWNIHFENIIVKEGSVIATNPAIINNDNTSISYSVTLSRSKDYYEFTVDVKNDGTLPGKMSLSNLSGITSEAESVINYSVTYTNGNSVNIGDILNAGAKKTIKVRVYYKDDISSADLPSSNINLTLTYTLQYIQSDENVFDTDVLVEQLKAENPSCFTKYIGQVTDQPGETVTASNVYFNKCLNKRNIIFNNMCWQMIRTTETSGIKMIYNGDVVDGKCLSSRGSHKGIIGNEASTETLNSNYLYGDSFTYDITNNIFTLTDTITATWNDSTYEGLIGKYTCKNDTGTCATIYNINGYNSNIKAYTSSYTLGDSNYSEIGSGPYNANVYSPAMVGYMFNKVYAFKEESIYSVLTGNDVIYSNGTYTLLPASGESTLGTKKDSTHHYTCNNTTGTCNKVRFYYNNNFYIELDGEKNIDEVVNNMLYNNNVNRYNSSIKGIIDAWYRQNLLSKTNMLEDTVYCNARDMLNQNTNGWNNNGTMSEYMIFKNNNNITNLECHNITDQFAVGNTKATLKYPIALLQDEEISIINNSSLFNNETIWTLSPNYFGNWFATMRELNDGTSSHDYVTFSHKIRPVITLSNNNVITSGTGAEEDPWIVE